MALVMSVRLREGRYDAAAGWAETVEWPPAPSRMFCALVASDPSREERLALAWLEQQAPPHIWASPVQERFRADGFVVTNKTSGKGGSQSWPGRTSAPRTRVAAMPQVPEFAFVWPRAEPSTDVVQVLGDLAWKVPYLGRSTSTVAIRVHTAPVMRTGWQVYEPTTLDGPVQAGLGVPYPGYLQALDRVFEEGGSAWEVARTVGYTHQTTTPPQEAATVPVVRGPFSSLMVFSFARDTVRPGSEELLTLTRKLRESVMARIGQDVPAQVSGHEERGRRHVAYLALPDVGHDQARGSLFGLALALPQDLDAEAAAAVYRSVVADPLTHLNRGHGPVFDLAHQAAHTGPWALHPARWSAPAHGSRVWVSATPLMLDRFTRPNSDLADFVSQAVTRAGYPAPAHVQVSQAPMMRGSLHRPPRHTYPPDRPRRRVLHARIEFAEPVAGPVLVGSMRYLGLGLFAPLTDAPARTVGEKSVGEVVDARR